MSDLGGPDIFFATVAELNARLRGGDFKAVELARGFGRRLEALGPRYNALALPLTEVAIRRARHVDEDLRLKRYRSRVQGVPYGAKDLLAFAGHPTTWGARPYAGQVFDYNAAAIDRLDKSGAVLAGKLAMVELAGGPSYRYAAASLTGPGLNPWDRTRWSGGSSSGSGAAVAAGLVPFAIGSETSGSILTPSAFCGITGLRPTYGLVSRYGAMALSWTLDKLGPMCHSAEDCGLVLEALAGGDGRDPASAGKGFYYTPQFARPMKDLRIGYAEVDFAEWADPAARPAFAQALADLRATGATLVETKLPEFPYGPVIATIISSEGSSAFEPLISSAKVDELADARQIAGLRAGLEVPAKDYLKAMRIRSLIRTAFGRLFEDLDLLLAPSRLGTAPKITEPLDRRAADRPAPAKTGLTALIPAGNLAGLPAISFPCGFAESLPVGLQLAGPPFTENRLLAAAHAYQERTAWHTRHPEMG